MSTTPLLTEERLDNGLRLAIRSDSRVPIVAVNLWYHVGSANERKGRTGFAHLFEHMLFQGSEHVEANEHFALVQRAGGTLNGSTWLDRTNYFETVPSNQLDLALWLEADRMGHLLPAMTQEKLDTQRDVVKNERRWTIDNQPYGSWWERLPALAFPPAHPFHHSLMGSMEDLSAATLDDVKEFFATYYTPDNAVLSIVGDVEAGDVQDAVKRYFGGIPAGRGRPLLDEMQLPPTFGDWVRETVEDNVSAPRLFLAMRIPPLGDPDHDAAAMCAAILGNGRGSRLHRALVRERQIATSATAFTFDLAKGSDLLVVDVMGRPATPALLLEEAVAHELDLLVGAGLQGREAERACALLSTAWTSEMQTAQVHADKLSQFATYFGDASRAYGEVAGLRSTSPQAIHEFATRFMGQDNRISLLYVPRAGHA